MEVLLSSQCFFFFQYSHFLQLDANTAIETSKLPISNQPDHPSDILKNTQKPLSTL